MRRVTTLLLAALAACTATPLEVLEDSGGERGEAVIELLQSHGVPVVEGGPGSPLTLVVADVDLVGRTITRKGCRRVAVVASCDCPHLGAHEVLHLLGLEHVKDPGNLMYEGGAREGTLTAKQVATAISHTELLSRCQ